MRPTWQSWQQFSHSNQTDKLMDIFLRLNTHFYRVKQCVSNTVMQLMSSVKRQSSKNKLFLILLFNRAASESCGSTIRWRSTGSQATGSVSPSLAVGTTHILPTVTQVSQSQTSSRLDRPKDSYCESTTTSISPIIKSLALFVAFRYCVN